MKGKNFFQKTTAEKKPFIQEIIEYIIWIALIVVVAQFITRYVGVFSVVDGESMEPNLHHGEYLWVDKLQYKITEPKRFDVVIFPVEYGSETRHFVKRIIGLPGETIQIDADGVIYINGEALEESYGKEEILEYTRYRAASPVTLGEDEYFVMGDNRNHSSDSRMDLVGNVKKEEFLGKAIVRLWPLNKIGIVK